MDRRVQAAIRLMNVEAQNRIDLGQLANTVNLSRWHFARLFKAELSISPNQYIRRLKIRKAQCLLSESFLSVKEVAARIGFGDRSHFSRDFKKVCGQTPSHFKTRLESK